MAFSFGLDPVMSSLYVLCDIHEWKRHNHDNYLLEFTYQENI